MRLLDAFCGEGGATAGYDHVGFDVHGVDNDPERLVRYRAAFTEADAVAFILEHGNEFDAIHASPPCQGYSRATSALPDRFDMYDRLIPAVRDALLTVGKPYVIENVYDARRELIDPVMLCGRSFALSTTDDDGELLVMDRHRMFETNWPLIVPEHKPHDSRIQVAGSYGGARRDKWEARYVRKGGYVPSVERQRELLGTPWMSEQGCYLSIPPVFTQFIGIQLRTFIEKGPRNA